MTSISITVGPLKFSARFEEKNAPHTCAAFRARLPFASSLIQARWSGESAWSPLGDLNLGIPVENATSHPSRGDILFYQAAASETEILFPYGSTCFASKVGQLAGNHFLTLTSGLEQLPELGRLVLWEGAQPIRFTLEMVPIGSETTE
ncbi:MAG: DUF3830 family protein [Gemmatimonadaceae bacterium]